MFAPEQRESDENDDDTFINIKIKSDDLVEVKLNDKFAIFLEPVQRTVMQQIIGNAETSRATQFSKIVRLGPVPATYDVLFEPLILRDVALRLSSKKTSHYSIGLANLTAMQALTKKQCLSRNTRDEVLVDHVVR